MKQVIFIEQPKEQVEKPVEFTKKLHSSSLGITEMKPNDYDKIVYLGKGMINKKDLFAAYSSIYVDIFEGHLNSGKY